MPYQPFPPDGYLANAGRTQSEMKNAFEQWNWATKRSGHGGCQLVRHNATWLRLLPFGDRVMQLAYKPYLVPYDGIYLDLAGKVGANQWAYIVLQEDSPGNVFLWPYAIGGGFLRYPDFTSESGVSVLSVNSGASMASNTAIVGMIYTDQNAQLRPESVLSLFNAYARSVSSLLTGPWSIGATGPIAVLSIPTPTWAHDNVLVQAEAVFTTGAGASTVSLMGYINGVAQGQAVGYSSTVMLPPNQSTTMSITWPSLPYTNDSVVNYELWLRVDGGAITLQIGTKLTVTRRG